MNSIPAVRSVSTQVGPCGRPIPGDSEAMLQPAEAAFLLGLALRTLEADRIRGSLGIPFFKLGARAVRYRRGDLEAWLAACRRLNTSDAGDTK